MPSSVAARFQKSDLNSRDCNDAVPHRPNGRDLRRIAGQPATLRSTRSDRAGPHRRTTYYTARDHVRLEIVLKGFRLDFSLDDITVLMTGNRRPPLARRPADRSLIEEPRVARLRGPQRCLLSPISHATRRAAPALTARPGRARASPCCCGAETLRRHRRVSTIKVAPRNSLVHDLSVPRVCRFGDPGERKR